MMYKNFDQPFAVIFDMDGVIVDSNPTHTIALRKFCEVYGHLLTEDELKMRIYGRANKDWLPDIFGDQMTPAEYKKLADEKEALFRKLFEPIIQPLNGLHHFLQSLKNNDVSMAVASSAPPANVEFTLAKTFTKKYFDVILNESDIENGKPDPEIYLKTASLLNISPECCIVFEDSMAGVEAAKNAGCRVIGVTTTHRGEEFVGTDLVIDDFEDLGVLDLKQLFGS